MGKLLRMPPTRAQRIAQVLAYLTFAMCAAGMVYANCVAGR